MSIKLIHLPIEYLHPGLFQPRKYFDQTSIFELAESIKSQGIIEPLIVRKISGSKYEIIAGERRWRAAQSIPMSTVPCLLGNYTDEQAAAVTLIENIQRQALNLIEEAQGFFKLTDSFHFQQDEVATLVGKSRSYIANSLRLLKLTQPTQKLVINQQLSAGHARMLVGLKASDQQTVVEKIIKQKWSVRKTEREIQALKNPSATSAPHTKDNDTIRLQSYLSEQLGTPIEIAPDSSSSGGWIKIKYYDNDTFSGLLEKLGFKDRK